MRQLDKVLLAQSKCEINALKKKCGPDEDILDQIEAKAHAMGRYQGFYEGKQSILFDSEARSNRVILLYKILTVIFIVIMFAFGIWKVAG